MDNPSVNITVEKKSSAFFDVAIVGGGLAGLSLSILLSQAGYKVALFEKEEYPFHRVCGEYISLESYNFIQRLGMNLSDPRYPLIKKLIVSSPNGNFIQSPLDPGGIGISRFHMDYELKKIAVQNGVFLKEKTKVNDIAFDNDHFKILYDSGEVTCKVAVGSFGKRSNLDKKWNRSFIQQKPGRLNNYIGIKYHIKTSFPSDTIALHNFKNGYCGVSKVEDENYCLCYLTTARNLNENNNSIAELEKNVLSKNPFLKTIFSEAEFVFKNPVAISQISFDKKTLIENHVLMTGDAAGMITPLCGNGMSIALHSSKIAFEIISKFLTQKISRKKMEKQYSELWMRQFDRRLKNGRFIQKLFGKEMLTNSFIGGIKSFPFLIKNLIKTTHGNEF
ncbi:MAG: NAD(P)/FAD-dependent oxidoreductase [Ginsengibacter sp.]